jgi:hypothetical protein
MVSFMPLVDALPKLRLLIPRLATDSEGEMVATVNAICRTLKSSGADLHDLAAAIGTPSSAKNNQREEPKREKPKSSPTNKWRDVLDFCMSNLEWMSEREKTFVSDMKGNLDKWGSPTEKQGAWLMSIYRKLGGTE